MLAAAGGLAVVAGAAFLAGDRAMAGEIASDWVNGHAHRVRLIAGRGAPGTAGGASPAEGIVAGIEIELDPGWKTYWRHPGDAGGVPPTFDWSGSRNLAAAKVAFPSPKRMSDITGDVVGYKEAVVLPVRVTADDAGQPVTVAVSFAFGVCSDICVPAQADLSVEVPVGASGGLPEPLTEALAKVPRGTTEKLAGDPEIVRYEAVVEGSSPRLVVDVSFPGGQGHVDVFGEAPPGVHLPMAQRQSDADVSAGVVRFAFDLNDALDLAELRGQTITLTLVGEKGQSERTVRLP